MLCLICLSGVSCWLCGSSSRCHGFVCGCDCGISWSYSLTILKTEHRIKDAGLGVIIIAHFEHFVVMSANNKVHVEEFIRGVYLYIYISTASL